MLCYSLILTLEIVLKVQHDGIFDDLGVKWKNFRLSIWRRQPPSLSEKIRRKIEVRERDAFVYLFCDWLKVSHAQIYLLWTCVSWEL